MTDNYHGQGGSYLLDPATGQRTLVERTQDAATETIAETLAAPASAEQPKE